MFPSPNGVNQQVGIDPEFIFAWPKGSGLERSPEPSPRRNPASIEISLDGGKTWKHPSSTAPFNATDHKYDYSLTGDDNALQVRLVDSPSADNYGRVQIVVQPAEEELWLDSRSGTPIRGEMVLERGKPYRVTMQGTYSAWKFPAPGAKSGKPAPSPMWPSPKGTNKLVGVDPEFVFAWPKGSGLEKSSEPAPLRNSTIEVSLDGGKTWKHPSSTASFNEADHKYTYELTGDGNVLQVRLVDRPYTDNYGRVQIFVQPGA
jgi:BNR/Asp-box repeat